jgi:acetyl-CoA acetyltransferase
MSKYGTRREEMAEFALNARRWGLMWEYGYWYQHRPEMLTRDAYLNARMISWPTSMLDCDIPVQGAGALVISAADRALDLRNRPAYIVGTAQGPRQVRPRVYVTPFEEAETNFAKVASDLWADSGLSPSDISVANLYDGFTIFTPLWLEALGFCEYGEAFSFASFDRTGVDGPFPLNTSGGSQGAGRMHGIPQLMDGALQVMGRSGQRQIEDVQFSLVTIGASHNAGAVIFSTEPRSA